MRVVIGMLLAMAAYGQMWNGAGAGTRDDSGVTWIPPTATFASPPASPPTGAVYVFTDASAAGTCAGTGSFLATCRWNGATWVATGGSSTGGASITGLVSGNSTTIVPFGDSITTKDQAAADGPTSWNGYGHTTWTSAILGQAFQVLNNAGVSGNTTQDMINRINTDVIAYAPAWCFVMGGINDVSTGVSATTIIAHHKTIYAALAAAGIKEVLYTMLPSAYVVTDSAKQLVWATVNQWMKEYAKTVPNLILVDAAAVMIDGTQSTITAYAGMTTDGTHPTIGAFWLLGKATAAAIKSYFTSVPTLPIWNSDPTNLVVNGLMAGTGGTLGAGASGVVATGWTLACSGGGSAVGSKGTRSDGISGATQIITMTGSGAASKCSITQTISSGAYNTGTPDLLYTQAETMSATVQDQMLLWENYHTSGGSNFFITWGAEQDTHTFPWGLSGTVTLPPLVMRTINRPLFSTVDAVTVGLSLYGTNGTATVGRFETRKYVAP